MDGIDVHPSISYWMTAYSKHDCFFVVESEPDNSERIGAFKMFLMGHSEVLRNELAESDLAENGDILIRDSDPMTFRFFLIVLYGGMNDILLKISFEQSIKLLYLFEKYLVLDFKEKMSDHLVKVLPLSEELTADVLTNFFVALSYPVTYQSENSLKKQMSLFLQYNTKEVLSHELFVELTPEAVLWIVKHDSLSVNEITLWEAVLKWAKHVTETDNGDVLRECMETHLHYIRFSTMPAQQFCAKVISTDILTQDEVFEICKSFGRETPAKINTICNNSTPRSTPPKIPETFEFCHVINRVFELSNINYNYSTSHVFQGFSWNIIVRREKKKMSFYLNCEPSTKIKENWELSPSVNLVILNRNGRNNFIRSLNKVFNMKQFSWGFPAFIDWDELVNFKNGYINNSNVIVMASVIVKDSTK